MTTATKKITVATVKSFIRKNRSNLLINVKSSFDSMQDMVTESRNKDFFPARARTYYKDQQEVEVSQDDKHTLGVSGVWFTGRDMCERFETETHIGFEVYNCCGTWRVAIAR